MTKGLDGFLCLLGGGGVVLKVLALWQVVVLSSN